MKYLANLDTDTINAICLFFPILIALAQIFLDYFFKSENLVYKVLKFMLILFWVFLVVFSFELSSRNKSEQKAKDDEIKNLNLTLESVNVNQGESLGNEESIKLKVDSLQEQNLSLHNKNAELSSKLVKLQEETIFELKGGGGRVDLFTGGGFTLDSMLEVGLWIENSTEGSSIYDLKVTIVDIDKAKKKRIGNAYNDESNSLIRNYDFGTVSYPWKSRIGETIFPSNTIRHFSIQISQRNYSAYYNYYITFNSSGMWTDAYQFWEFGNNKKYNLVKEYVSFDFPIAKDSIDWN